MTSKLSRLFHTADTPIRRNLCHDTGDAESLLQNSEVSAWLSRLAERSDANHIGDIHGSHDYRMENILGKCWILGLNQSMVCGRSRHPSHCQRTQHQHRYSDFRVKKAEKLLENINKEYFQAHANIKIRIEMDEMWSFYHDKGHQIWFW